MNTKNPEKGTNFFVDGPIFYINAIRGTLINLEQGILGNNPNPRKLAKELKTLILVISLLKVEVQKLTDVK